MSHCMLSSLFHVNLVVRTLRLLRSGLLFLVWRYCTYGMKVNLWANGNRKKEVGARDELDFTFNRQYVNIQYAILN